jgi:hypothetical protein
VNGTPVKLYNKNLTEESIMSIELAEKLQKEKEALTEIIVLMN